MKEKNRKAGLAALEKLKTVFADSLKDEINSASFFVVENFYGATDDALVTGYFSHKLKLLLEKFVKSLEPMLDDGVPHYRKASLELLMTLAKKLTYFQKEPLVMLIVNKIGDPDKMITQFVQKFIAVVIRNYAGIGKVILDAINIMLERSHLPDNTKFALLTCLANLNFEGGPDQLTINACNEIFMKEFLSNCTTKDESLSKIMNQCLRGLNKNLASLKDKSLLRQFYEEHTDRLFSMSHQAKLRVRVQILLLIFQLLKTEVHSKQMDRLMKVIYETLLDPSCLHSNITELFLELLYNAFKSDHSIPRVMAGVKRLLQNAIHSESNVAIAVLIFVNKLAKSVTGLNQLLKNSFTLDFEGHEENENGKGMKKEKPEEEGLEKDNGGYDFLKRDPLFAKADCSLLWELKYFVAHYHPTVKKIAYELCASLSTQKINYEGNPLLDFTTASFLDRFCMKKPKAGKIQAKKKLIDSNKVSRAKIEEPFSLQAAIHDSATKVRDDEKFMELYFKKKVDNMDYLNKLDKRKKEKAKFKVNEDEDAEDKFADELFENELRKAEGGRNVYLDEQEAEDFEEEEESGEEDFNVDDFDDEIREGQRDELDFEDDGMTLKKRVDKKGKKGFMSKPKKMLKRK